MPTPGTPAHRAMCFAATTARLLLVPMLALAACSTTRVVSDYDRSVRFASFRTFTVIVRPHPSTTSPLVEQRAYEGIRAELSSKGFTYVLDPAEADFLVDFTVGANDRLDVQSYPSPYGGPWFHAGWAGNQIDVNQFQEGTLAIDVFDAHRRKAVWHGSARKKLTQSDIATSELVIRDAVTAVLANFPPKEP